MNKEQQKQLLIEVMEADANDGLYKQQTAVEWLIDWMGKNQYFIGNDLIQATEQAKQMEKDKTNEVFKEGYNQGYLDAQCNHVNDADNLIYEREYVKSKIEEKFDPNFMHEWIRSNGLRPKE